MHATRAYSLAGALIVALTIIAYIVDYTVRGPFALPPAVLAWLTPLDVPLTIVAGYLLRGYTTGNWVPPWITLPAAQTGPLPAPPAPPSPSGPSDTRPGATP